MLENILKRLSQNSRTIHYSEESLEGFKKAQRLAFLCAETVGKEVKPGWNEKRTTDLMDTWLRDHGVKTFFHHSFAWFGNRSSFTHFKTMLDFLPKSNQILQENEAVILDTAPIFQGRSADIGYSFFVGSPPPEYTQAQKLLLAFRSELPLMFSSEMTTGEIWAKVDEKIKSHGFRNCHKDYPLAALGHRLQEHSFENFPGILKPFTLHSYMGLLSKGLIPEILGPFHEGSKLGVWAIEPHFGNDQFGIKFEEILIVTNEKVYWLDNQVPHLAWKLT